MANYGTIARQPNCLSGLFLILSPLLNSISLLKNFLSQKRYCKGFKISFKNYKKSIIECLTTYGTNCVFSAWVQQDNDDSNSWIIDLDRPALGMRKSYYVTENQAVFEIFDFFIEIFQKFRKKF